MRHVVWGIRTPVDLPVRFAWCPHPVPCAGWTLRRAAKAGIRCLHAARWSTKSRSVLTSLDNACLPHGVERADRAKPASHRLQFGYTVYRRVLGYYSGEEDALDMRKAMPRDVAKRSVVPLKRPVRPEDLECD
jgi:hypothetical protein